MDNAYAIYASDVDVFAQSPKTRVVSTLATNSNEVCGHSKLAPAISSRRVTTVVVVLAISGIGCKKESRKSDDGEVDELHFLK